MLSGIRQAGVAVGDTTSSNTCILVEHNHSPIKKMFIWENDYVPPFKQKRNGLKERNLPWGYRYKLVPINMINKYVYDINYGCIKYMNLNICNYYFHHATNIFHVYQKSKKKNIQYKIYELSN